MGAAVQDAQRTIEMSWKRIALGAVLVLLTKIAVGAVAFGLLLTDLQGASSPAFRPEGTEQHGVAMLGYFAWAAAFSLLFARGFASRGWFEGLRFGFVVWLLYFIPMTLGIHGYFVVEAKWTALALVSGFAEALACGSVAALVFRNARARWLDGARVSPSAGTGGCVWRKPMDPRRVRSRPGIRTGARTRPRRTTLSRGLRGPTTAPIRIECKRSRLRRRPRS